MAGEDGTAPGGSGMTRPLVTGYDWAPDEGRGLVRDMRVRWALEEVGQPYDERRLSWGEQKEPAHRARSPFGQVPTYEEGELVLFESGAIVFHIANRWPGLLPADTIARAKAIEWMFAALNSVEPAVWDLILAKFVEGDTAAARMPGVMQRLRTRLGELSTRLGDAEWLDGPFSAGDLLMVHVLRNLTRSGILAEFPNLAAYVARGEARPAHQRALAALRAGLRDTPPPSWTHPKGETT
jgi:glutathione S-transferase